MSYATILAIDLGKFKSVLCVMDVASRTHQFVTVESTPPLIRQAVQQRCSVDPAATLVVFETCDTCGWVHDSIVDLGVAIVIVNANDERWRWQRVKRKTDQDDALKLARLALLDQLPMVHLPDPQQRQRRRLMIHRRSIVSRRTQCRNAIRSIFSQQGIALARGQKQWTVAGVQQLQSYAASIETCSVEELWKGRLNSELLLMASINTQLKALDAKLDELADPRMKLLQTLKGVGPRTAEAVVLYVDDPKRFKSGEELASYAGLVPKQMQSGEMNRLGHITHRGPGLLRSMLVEAAWTIYRHNAWAQTFVNKISHGSKARRKLAIVALAKKVLIILWGMLKSNQPFRSPLIVASMN
jgi:transposase